MEFSTSGCRIMLGTTPSSVSPLIARQLPIREDGQVTGFVDLALERAFHYRPGEASERIEMPDAMVRTIAVFDKRLRTVLPELGVVRRCDNTKARTVLGHTFRAPPEAISTAAQSLVRSSKL